MSDRQIGTGEELDAWNPAPEGQGPAQLHTARGTRAPSGDWTL